ncbi:MAG: transketolase [Gammaproteobacteria bacterium]|nr:transketolase [Gammaproteobacteria bacterium]
MAAVHGEVGNQPGHLQCLRALESKVLWLASYMIHHANHVRPSRDQLKVGGHQASCASVVSLMTALYLRVLGPQDRVAVKPHASPVFHAIQYLLGQQSRQKLEAFRAFSGAQAYPSRTKDTDAVDFSTGSVGLGVAMTHFASLVQDYVHLQQLAPPGVEPGRMIAVVGDAELDEGNVFEALLEGWKHNIRNTWWIIDYNRQSLDSNVADRLFGPIEGLFRSMGWHVITLKYGKRLQAAFEKPGGAALRRWIDACPNSRYSALTFKGGGAWRLALEEDEDEFDGLGQILADYGDDVLPALMTNLAGHDLEMILEAFENAPDGAPCCFIAYTIKGYGLPFAGHKDNHAGLMTPEQLHSLRRALHIAEGQEWDEFAGLRGRFGIDEAYLRAFLREVPCARLNADQGVGRRHTAAAVPVPRAITIPSRAHMSTQDGFGRIMSTLARDHDELARHVVTVSPDVTVSTNLGGWVNRRDIFERTPRPDTFDAEQVASPQKWRAGPRGQHMELGIAEHNLFLLLGALGLSRELFGARLLPIGTLYDPFVMRGLDAFNYALYQDARFMVVATPSGVTLAPEGGAHQSIATPLIGMGLPNLASYEPTYVDELGAIMCWGLEHMQDEANGGSVYLRLSTRAIAQPERALPAADVTAGGYWLQPPGPHCALVIAYAGALGPEAQAAHRAVCADLPATGLLAITSAERLHTGWTRARRARERSAQGMETEGMGTGEMGTGEMAAKETARVATAHVEALLAAVPREAAIVSLTDAHPAALSWLGSVCGHRVVPLGVEHFGQSGDIPDLYAHYGLDSSAVLHGAARALLDRADPMVMSWAQMVMS